MWHSLLSDLICMHVMDTLFVPAHVKGTGHPKILTLFTRTHRMLFTEGNIWYIFLSAHFCTFCVHEGEERTTKCYFLGVPYL